MTVKQTLIEASHHHTVIAKLLNDAVREIEHVEDQRERYRKLYEATWQVKKPTHWGA